MKDWAFGLTYNLAKELAARPYDLVITPDKFTDGQKCWIAKSPELPGATGQGMTASQAVNDLILARTDLIWSMLIDGQEIPATNYSKFDVHWTEHISREAVRIDV